MIESVLPGTVTSAETFGDDPRAFLLPEEQELVARAVPRRRKEVATARSCARRALAEIGFDPVPIPRGPKREPVWPEGVVGSITHCRDYCAAAVARASQVRSVGIDAEIDDVLPTGVLDQVTAQRERKLLAALPAGHNWDRLLFSAKESVYKAWYPLTGRWLGFEDALVTVDTDGGFRAELLVEPPLVADRPLTGFSGRYFFGRGLVATAVVVDVASEWNT